MSAAKVKSASSAPTASDILNQLDLVIKFTQNVITDGSLPEYPEDYMHGYLNGLSHFRRYVRSNDFPTIISTIKETPKNAHRS